MSEEAVQKSGYGKRPIWQWVVLYVIIGAVVYGLIYYFVFANKGGYGSNQTGNPYQTPATQSQSQSAGQSGTSAATEITVEGNEFAFTPSTINVKHGQPVKIIFKNTGKYPHNLTVPDLNVQSNTIQTGEQDTISFTPSKIGTFPFSCTVPGHADKGMKGTLTVQ